MHVRDPPSAMCLFVSAITIYRCGAVEHVEKKVEDCKRKDCINSKKHPSGCGRKASICLLRNWQPEHSPACRDYHETAFAFENKPNEQCSDKSCKLVQDQDGPGFNTAVKAFRASMEELKRNQDRAEQDAASTRQLRDEPL